MSKQASFEDRLNELKEINEKLNSGLGLQDTLKYYKKGKVLANGLVKTLDNAKKTFAKVETNDGKEVPYNRDKNGKDIDENVKLGTNNKSKNHIPSDTPF